MSLLCILMCGLSLTGLNAQNYRVSVVCWGDSNTDYGQATGESWVDYLDAEMDNRGRYLNSGHAGWTMTQLNENYVADILYKFRDPGCVIILAGVNDDGQGATVDQIYARIKEGCALARATGAFVLVSTYPINPVNMFTVNDSIRTHWATFADGLIDPGSDANIGELSNHGNPTWWIDGVHWTVAGRARFAELYVAPAVRSLE